MRFLNAANVCCGNTTHSSISFTLFTVFFIYHYVYLTLERDAVLRLSIKKQINYLLARERAIRERRVISEVQFRACSHRTAGSAVNREHDLDPVRYAQAEAIPATGATAAIKQALRFRLCAAPFNLRRVAYACIAREMHATVPKKKCAALSALASLRLRSLSDFICATRIQLLYLARSALPLSSRLFLAWAVWSCDWGCAYARGKNFNSLRKLTNVARSLFYLWELYDLYEVDSLAPRKFDDFSLRVSATFYTLFVLKLHLILFWYFY